MVLKLWQTLPFCQKLCQALDVDLERLSQGGALSHGVSSLGQLGKPIKDLLADREQLLADK